MRDADLPPDTIATNDKTAPGTDTKVYVRLSCNRCHNRNAFGGNAGIMTLEGKEWARL